jgi:hypothetical protein
MDMLSVPRSSSTQTSRQPTHEGGILWRRILLEKITGSRLIKKFSSFYGTRNFITEFTSP